MSVTSTCPECGSGETLPVGDFDCIDAETYERSMKCEVCGTTWRNVFTLTDKVDVVQGTVVV